MENKKEIDVIGLGVSTVDILNVVDHFPAYEEVQKSIDGIIDGGGPVATAIVTLARLGTKVLMIDSLGDDWRGKLIVDGFKKENVVVDNIKIHNGKSSSSATILVRKNDGARTIIFSPGNAPEISEADISTELISKAKYVHVNGRHWNACLRVCMIAKECGTKISFDGGAHRYDEKLKQLIPLTDVCVVAKEFAFSCTKENNINYAAISILSEGPEIVVITDGFNGSWLFTKDVKGYHQKAFLQKDTIDTTGCGDSFHGAFIFGLCKGYNLFESMKIASAVAAINSKKLGGRSGLPAFEELSKFISKIN